jgi:hypothetical protein
MPWHEIRPLSGGLIKSHNLNRFDWLRGADLNRRPLGYEPNELPGCSTPQNKFTKGSQLGSMFGRRGFYVLKLGGGLF